MPIDGLVSGLDTNSIIDGLMKAERGPVELMTARKTAAQAAVDAYKSVQTKLAAVSTASAALERASGWTLRTATSSNPALASVTTADGATISGLQFTVDRLASTHGVATATNSPATSTVVASGGSIGITIGSTVHNIAVGTGTLAEVADAINSAGIGVKAATVNTGSGYRLQLTAVTSGAAAAFSVSSGLDLATVVTTQGNDAQLTIGTGPGAYSITSATNGFANVLPGVTITAKGTGSEVVTVDVKRDSEGLAKKIQTLVDTVNSALAEIKTRTAYDPSSKTASSLAGDAAARRVTQSLTRALSDVVSQSTLGSPGLAGISLDRNGKATFDSAKFTAAYAADPAAVERLFVQGGTSTGDVTFLSAGSRAVGGERSVVVTQAAARANAVGLVGPYPTTVPATVRIRVGTADFVFQVEAGKTESEVVDGLQAGINAAGFRLTVAAESGSIAIKSNSYGSAATFNVDWGTGTYATFAGTDAAGTIDGITATGNGRQLSLPATDGQLSGLSVLLTSDNLGPVGTVNYEPGLAQRLSSAVVAATDSASGYVTNASSGRQSRVDLLASSISSYETRLELREKRLRAEFASLEVTLSRLKEQSGMLTSQLGIGSS